MLPFIRITELHIEGIFSKELYFKMRSVLEMEDKVVKIYKEFTFFKWKVALVMICFIIILSLGVSIFLGPPFLHRETIDFIYVWQPGWLIEREYLIYVIIIISAIIASLVETWNIQGTIASVRNVLYKECDADLFLEIADCGLKYVTNQSEHKNRNIKNKYKLAYMYFERFYVEALNAKGRYIDALEYLENDWRSKRNTLIYQLLIQNVKLNIAWEQEDKKAYNEVFNVAMQRIKKSEVMIAQRLILEENYYGAIKMLEAMKPRVCYEKVIQYWGFTRCYIKLGNYEKAKVYIDFILEHGKSTIMKEKALEMMNRLIDKCI